MFRVGEFQDIRGELRTISNWVRNLSHSDVLTYIDQLMCLDEWVVEHPVKPSVKTTARASKRVRFANVVFFNSASNDDPWALIQTGDFVNGALINGVLYQLHGHSFGEQAVKNAALDLLRDDRFKHEYLKHDKFGGAIVAHKRPAHYFYDQLLNLPLVDIPDDKYIAIDHQCFFDPSRLGFSRVKQTNDDEFYVSIATIAGDVNRARKMEDSFQNVELTLPEAFHDADTRLWIGVANEKRSWIDQVSGYSRVVNELAATGKTIAVVIDGFTAFDGQTDVAEADNVLFDELKSKLNENVQVYSVIGRDYATKIGYCLHVDAFITYVGTQAMVPLRFAKKPGILHSNSIYGANERYPKAQRVLKIPAAKITDIPSDSSEKSDYMSYFFHWEVLYNMMIDLLGYDVPRLSEPSPKTLDELPKPALEKVDYLNQIALKIQPFNQSADVLREIAETFEKIGDYKTASALMESALILRPSGKLIQQKAAEYKKILNT